MSKKLDVLIIEDDNHINNLLKEILQMEGYLITQAFSGTEGKLWLDQKDFKLILLDLMLPGISGEEILPLIREKYTMPIIIISAKIDMETKVKLLRNGADDFVEKPFDVDEVMARVEAQLRRYLSFSSQTSGRKLEVKNLKLIEEEMRVMVKGEEVKLTNKEYDILHLLLSNPKKVFTKANLFQSVWAEDYYMDDNTLNVHISNIRNKISKYDKENEYIETVWGIGFKLRT